MKKIDITGQKFGFLTAVKPSSQKQYWWFKCDCGEIKKIKIDHVKAGATKSCGCYLRITLKARATHKMSKERFYLIFQKMKSRCANFKIINYGKKGIKVEWKSFEQFKTDMYESYLDHVESFGENQTTIDRIDSNKNYCKENCRWATYKEQGRNTKQIKLHKYKGQIKCVAELAEIYKISAEALYARLRRNWSIEKAIETPIIKKYHPHKYDPQMVNRPMHPRKG